MNGVNGTLKCKKFLMTPGIHTSFCSTFAEKFVFVPLGNMPDSPELQDPRDLAQFPTR